MIVEIKQMCQSKCTELIQYEYKSNVGLLREVTLQANVPSFKDINGLVTHFALRRIFKSFTLAVVEAPKYIEDQRPLNWCQGDCECEDSPWFSLPC